jgi:hypothetical protein
MPAFTPHEFVSKWKRAEARERQSVQEHFIDLCRLVAEGGPHPGPSPIGGGEPQRRGEKRTLTNLYNALPTWLDLAHKRHDAAVFAAYGWESDMKDEEILEKLLALNLERAEESH